MALGGEAASGLVEPAALHTGEPCGFQGDSRPSWLRAAQGSGWGAGALTWPGSPWAPGCCDPGPRCILQRRAPTPAGQTDRCGCPGGDHWGPGGSPPPQPVSRQSPTQSVPRPTTEGEAAPSVPKVPNLAPLPAAPPRWLGRCQ